MQNRQKVKAGNEGENIVKKQKLHNKKWNNSKYGKIGH